MNISILTQYIRPELTILPVALYFVGIALKNSIYIKDHFIPFILGFISLALATIYILAASPAPTNYQEVLSLIFDSIIQGVFCAAVAVYSNQIKKQYGKMKDGE